MLIIVYIGNITAFFSELKYKNIIYPHEGQKN